jgi:hypothetical protein
VGILGLLVLGTLASPVLLPLVRPPQASLPETARIQLLERPDAWVLQYNLLNDGPAASVFAYEVAFDGQVQRATPFLEPGEAHQMVSHIPKELLTTGEVHFTVSRADEPDPLEDLVFHLGPGGTLPTQAAGRGAGA